MVYQGCAGFLAKTRDNIENACGKHVGGDPGQLHDGNASIFIRFEDHCVSRSESRCNLERRHYHGIVPGNDLSTYAQWHSLRDQVSRCQLAAEAMVGQRD
ncbi:Uncharacterised protein [Mycobacteroides abscessus subsp. abscessus]|nr:Uncharacterised protein [Mycobacteroides abscessus subsp. abscessus]